MRTEYSYYSGGCGADIGLCNAGYTHVGGVEYDPAIAAVATDNGYPLTVADVRSVDPALLLHEAPDWFHASPVCKSFSQAKTDGKELQSDIEMAQATARFIRYWLPANVSIENVWQYRDSASFKCITDCLTECGYSFDYWHLNAADYGVAQTRRRLILVARRGLWHIQRPNPTHRDGGDMFTPPWVGWYEAIADLVPTLPPSRFADWQLARLPDGLIQTSLVNNGGFNGGPLESVEIDRPSFTVVSSLVRKGAMPRAFIVEGSAAGLDNPYPMQVRGPDEPVFTMRARQNNPQAWLIGSENACQEWGGTRYGDEPAMTISTKQKPRAWLTTGRVVSMTPRALARFQSFPDSYELPSKNALACTVVGNAVPPLLMQRIAESIT